MQFKESCKVATRLRSNSTNYQHSLHTRKDAGHLSDGKEVEVDIAGYVTF